MSAYGATRGCSTGGCNAVVDPEYVGICRFDHCAGDTEPQAPALHLYMLLLITWLAGFPPAVRVCLSLHQLVRVLVTCIKARLVYCLRSYVACLHAVYIGAGEACCCASRLPILQVSCVTAPKPNVTGFGKQSVCAAWSLEVVPDVQAHWHPLHHCRPGSQPAVCLYDHPSSGATPVLQQAAVAKLPLP